MEPNTLSVTLEVVRHGTGLYAQLRFSNPGKLPFALERSLSGEDVPAGRALFEVVDENGAEVPFIGMSGKRDAPEFPDDYVVVQPGAELRTIYPFDKEYAFPTTGKRYRIRYDVVNTLPDEKGLAFLTSNPAGFTYP
ncbi:hypothetical protein EZJ19_00495 [Parasulfuritortus cantonensis]|uniref:Uncharacterized protein n=1 Tax=Parasulfuritortus cantonensis TaxID=2528202 RepID=A0A4R1BS11_9PROT|nr:hypothetical protein [Parasulfuritortus cantonensis]TCJ20408.1 hypothetical protein EZJ19_00495 [Parasulfuritortus cantonensis]